MNAEKKVIRALLALVFLFVAGIYTSGTLDAWAQHTDTYNADTQASGSGGVAQNCITFSGTHGDDSTLTVTLPSGFLPKWGIYMDNAAAGAAPVVYLWTREMADASATMALAGGSTAFTVSADIDLDDTTVGSWIIDADVTTNGGTYYGILCR